MAVQPVASQHLTTLTVPKLCASYHRLNELRLDVDRRIASLDADNAGRETLWGELESLLVRLRAVIGQLAAAGATDLDQLRAKAEVVSGLRSSRDPDGSQIIPESEFAALALSLADDVVRLPEC